MEKTTIKVPYWVFIDLISSTAWSLFAVYTAIRFLPAFLFWEYDVFWTPALFMMEFVWLILAGWFFHQFNATFDKFQRGELDV